MDEIRKEIFKGKLSISIRDRFQIYEKQKGNQFVSLNIMAVSNSFLFSGDILTDKKSNLIGCNLWSEG